MLKTRTPSFFFFLKTKIFLQYVDIFSSLLDTAEQRKVRFSVPGDVMKVSYVCVITSLSPHCCLSPDCTGGYG